MGISVISTQNSIDLCVGLWVLYEENRASRSWPAFGRRFGDQIATRIQKYICIYEKKSNSRNFWEIEFPEVLLIFFVKKIHFLILPKQNTFTKPEKLKNCVNTANTKTKSIFILFWLQTMTTKSTCICVCFENTNTE